MKKVPPLKKFSFRDFFPRKRVVDDEIALLCNTDYDCWFYSTLCIPFLFEKMYTVCIVYYSVKNNTLMYSCWLTTTLSLLSPMIFKQHTGAWNTHNNKKATKNIYFKNRKKRCFVLIRIRIQLHNSLSGTKSGNFSFNFSLVSCEIQSKPASPNWFSIKYPSLCSIYV